MSTDKPRKEIVAFGPGNQYPDGNTEYHFVVNGLIGSEQFSHIKNIIEHVINNEDMVLVSGSDYDLLTILKQGIK